MILGKVEKPEDVVDFKAMELIEEFQSHYENYIQEHPEDADRKSEIFQSWIIQKIAGIQLSIIEIANNVNRLVDMSNTNKAPF